MSVRIQKLLKNYSDRDYNALLSIYKFRCLSFNQLFDLHYRFNIDTGEEVTDAYFRKKILKMERDELVEKVYNPKVGDVYFLTTDGVKAVVRAFDMPANIYDVYRDMHVRGYLTYSELKVAPRFIAHQYHLNDFVLNLLDKFNDTHYEYKDEKHIDNFIGIRPDAILKMYDIDFFLEMDMGTETTKQLTEKWENYRRFLDSHEFYMNESKIVVLFIVDGVKRVEERKDLIKKTIFDMLIDKVDHEFEIYVDTKEGLLEILEDRIIPETKDKYINIEILKKILEEKFAMKSIPGSKTSKLFDGLEYDLYTRKEVIVNNKRQIVVQDGKVQEFLIDDFTFSPISVINKLVHLDSKSFNFKKNMNRDISLIVIVDDEDYIFHTLRLFNIVGTPNVYYTTLERLTKYEFEKALFNFDIDGKKYHYNDKSLTGKIYENI